MSMSEDFFDEQLSKYKRIRLEQFKLILDSNDPAEKKLERIREVVDNMKKEWI